MMRLNRPMLVLEMGILAASVILYTTSGHAQISQATLQGIVRDQSGAVVPGASVTLTNAGTRQTRSTTTSSSGQYVIPNVEAGEYSFSATATGFKKFVISSLVLHTGEKATENVTLAVGATTQQVTVRASAALLQSVSGDVSTLVSPTQVSNIPLNGRRFWELAQLTPGATFKPRGEVVQFGGSEIRARSVNVSVNGQSSIWTGWSLDGANITNFELGGTLISPNVDAIQEFQVQSSNMSAQYGNTPSMVNASIKSGTNHYHGDVFEYFRNEKLDARNFFFKDRSPLKRNQFGATFGGPIKRDRAWFFVDYQGTRRRQGTEFNSVVPSLAERQGDFSELLPKTIIDPLTGQPFNNNMIPASRIASQSKFFLNYLPEPNAVQGTTSRFLIPIGLSQDQDEGDVRVDATLTEKDTLMARYSGSFNREDDPRPFPALGSTPLVSHANDGTLRWTHTLNPHWINTAQFAYYDSPFLFSAVLQGQDIDAMAGVQGFSNPLITPIPSFPTINISGFARFQGSPSDQRPKGIRVRHWQYQETMAYTRNKHSIKFGMEWLHRIDSFAIGSDAVGTFNFSNTYTGNGFSDFLLGFPDSVSRRPFLTQQGNYDSFKSWWFQDDYRATPNLTLNFGLRYEVNPFFHGLRGTITGFNGDAEKVVIPATLLRDQQAQPLLSRGLVLYADRYQTNTELGLPDSIRPSDKDWAPRFGLAWRPLGSEKTVVRGAYGIFYAFPDTNLFNNIINAPPLVISETVFNDRPPAVPTRTFGDYFLGQPLGTFNPNPGQPCPFGLTLISCDTPGITSAPLSEQQQQTQQWNLSIERQISNKVALTVGYVGSHTIHLQQFVRRNDPSPAPGDIQLRRPMPQYGPTSFTELGGNATYNGLQMKLEARDWHGLTLLGAYSYSKCMDTGSNEGSAPISLLNGAPNNAVCDFDQTHAGVISYYYGLPFGRGKSFLKDSGGVVNQLVGGWQISGSTTLQSGLPYTPTISGDRANTGTGGQRPNLIGKPVTTGNPNCFFFTSSNASCRALFPNVNDSFAVPAQYTLGTSGRNILRSDHLTQFDLSVLKNFPITESKQLQFRSEFFNAFNQTAFARPGTNINISSGGQVSATLNSNRVIEFVMKFIF